MNSKVASQTPCRNILIHGYCKYADKGCIFKHDNGSETSTASSAPVVPKKKLSTDSAVFTPSTSFHPSTAKNVAAPVFTPRSAGSISEATPIEEPVNATPVSTTRQFDPAKVFSPSAPVHISTTATDDAIQSELTSYGPIPPRDTNLDGYSMTHTGAHTDSNIQYPGLTDGNTQYARAIDTNIQYPASTTANIQYPAPTTTGIQFPASTTGNMQYSASTAANIQYPLTTDSNMTYPSTADTGIPYSGPPDSNMAFAGPRDPNMAFAGTNQTSIYQNNSAYPLMYHLYAPKPLGVNRNLLDPHQRLVEDFFISNDIREELQRKNEATRQAIPGLQLPDCVHVYHSLVPLDTNINKSNKIYGYPTWAYKVESNLDGRIYCMRRVEGYKLTNEKSMRLLKWWARVNSPGVVGLKEAFTTKAFGDNSLIFIYDYYPLCSTLESVYYDAQNIYQIHGTTKVSESILWGYAAQLLNSLKSIHKAKLAARIIEPSKIILTGKNRIRLNCCGIMDFLKFDSSDNDMIELQKQDLIKTGKLLLTLAATSQSTSVETNLEICRKKYSGDYLSLMEDLLEGLELKEIMNKYGSHFMDVIDSSLFDCDKLEGELSKEVENGRLVRLLAKLGFINDRPEYQNDRSWSEQGERYLLQLFRDYVFHQTNDEGNPYVDLNHVLNCLNKLDAGIDETVLLISRDEQSSYIVSYKELKNNVEAAFRELSRK